MPDRYKAQLDGFELEIETLSDSWSKALVEHEYPWSNGVDVDDMGLRGRTVRMRCWFYDRSYSPSINYETHYGFLEHLKLRRVFQLVHPEYGLLYGRVRSWSRTHDDRDHCAIIDIEFLETRETENDVTWDERIVPELEVAFASGLAQQKDSFIRRVKDAVGAAPGAGIVSRVLDSTKTILENFDDLTGTAYEFVKEIDTATRAVEDTLSRISNPASSVINTIELGTSLPGRVLGAVANAVERYAEAAATITSAPSQFLASYYAGVSQVKNAAAELASEATVSGALYGSARLGYLYDEDETRRRALTKKENARVWSRAGHLLIDDVPQEALTANELERSLASANEKIQDAIDTDRSVAALKTCSRVLVYHVNTVKLERERIETIEIKRETPLHMICVSRGLPYTYAERIWRLNPQIKNPQRTIGEIKVYVNR